MIDGSASGPVREPPKGTKSPLRRDLDWIHWSTALYQLVQRVIHGCMRAIDVSMSASDV